LRLTNDPGASGPSRVCRGGRPALRRRQPAGHSTQTSRVGFQLFRSGKEHNIELSDRRLARIVKQIQDLPGQELFQYLDDDGERHSIGSSDVNDYIREISGADFTAKDFRTWNGTVLAMRFLRACDRPTSAAAGKRQVSSAIKDVARQLGNTPAVARRAYVHPVVMNAYLEGYLEPEASIVSVRRFDGDGVTDEEQCALKLLEAGLPARTAAAA
jgi:DNA topoisomerase-1